MLSILCVRLTIKVKVGIPESFKVGWYPPKETGSSHLKAAGKVKSDYVGIKVQRKNTLPHRLTAYFPLVCDW